MNHDAYNNLLEDFIHEHYDTEEIITFISVTTQSTVERFIQKVRDRYDYHAERQEEHTPLTLRLSELLDHLEVTFL